MKRTPPIKDILWMIELGYSDNEISKKVCSSRNTIQKIRKKTAEVEKTDIIESQYNDEEVYNMLFGIPEYKTQKAKPEMDKYLVRIISGAEIKGMYQEYVLECKETGKTPLCYKQFCHYCAEAKKEVISTSDRTINAGERAVVTWLKNPVYYTNEKNQKVRCYIFVGILPFSKYAYLQIFEKRTIETWLKGNVEMLEYFGGIPKEIYSSENRYSSLNGSLQPQYREFACHYSMLVLLNHDEHYSEELEDIFDWFSVQFASGSCTSFEDAQQLVSDIMERYSKTVRYNNKSIYEKFLAGERRCLRLLPAEPFKPARRETRKILINSHIKHEGVYYSVPFRCALKPDKEVEIEIVNNKLSIYYRGSCVAEHPYIQDGKGYMTHLCDMPVPEEEHLLKWNSKKFLEWAERIGPNTKKVIENVLGSKEFVQQAYLHCMTILGFEKEYSRQDLEWACAHISKIPSGPMFQRIETLIKKNEG